MTTLSKASSTATTGWVASAEPAVAPAGCCVSTSLLGAAGMTVIPLVASDGRSPPPGRGGGAVKVNAQIATGTARAKTNTAASGV